MNQRSTAPTTTGSTNTGNSSNPNHSDQPLYDISQGGHYGTLNWILLGWQYRDHCRMLFILVKHDALTDSSQAPVQRYVYGIVLPFLLNEVYRDRAN